MTNTTSTSTNDFKERVAISCTDSGLIATALGLGTAFVQPAYSTAMPLICTSDDSARNFSPDELRAAVALIDTPVITAENAVRYAAQIEEIRRRHGAASNNVTALPVVAGNRHKQADFHGYS